MWEWEWEWDSEGGDGDGGDDGNNTVREMREDRGCIYYIAYNIIYWREIESYEEVGGERVYVEMTDER